MHVFLTRIVFENRVSKDKWMNLSFTTNFSKNFMKDKDYHFMSMYKKSFTVWGVAVLICVVSFAVRGLSRSIDFTGGRNYVVTLNKPTQVEDVRKVMNGAFVNTVGENAGSRLLLMLLLWVQTVRLFVSQPTITLILTIQWRTIRQRQFSTMR